MTGEKNKPSPYVFNRLRYSVYVRVPSSEESRNTSRNNVKPATISDIFDDESRYSITSLYFNVSQYGRTGPNDYANKRDHVFTNFPRAEPDDMTRPVRFF